MTTKEVTTLGTKQQIHSSKVVLTVGCLVGKQTQKKDRKSAGRENTPLTVRILSAVTRLRKSSNEDRNSEAEFSSRLQIP